MAPEQLMDPGKGHFCHKETEKLGHGKNEKGKIPLGPLPSQSLPRPQKPWAQQAWASGLPW